MKHESQGKNREPTRGERRRSGRILYRVGGVAALTAALVFRRNWGAEFLLLRMLGIISSGPQEAPGSAGEWFVLLQDHRLVGLILFNLFDLVNYALVGLILLGLYAALQRTRQGIAILAAACGLVGIAVAFASNQALAMLSLSERYAMTTTETEQMMLLAAGETLLAIDNPGLYPGTGAYISLLLVTLASVMMAIAMARSEVFGRATGVVGLVAEMTQLGYFVALALAPGLAALPPSLAAPFRLAWYLMLGRRLLQLGAAPEDVP